MEVNYLRFKFCFKNQNLNLKFKNNQVHIALFQCIVHLLIQMTLVQFFQHSLQCLPKYEN